MDSQLVPQKLSAIWRRIPRVPSAIWLSQIIGVMILWNYLPNTLTSILLALLLTASGVMLYLKQVELPIFTSIALLLSVTHFWLSSGVINPLLASTMIFLGISLSGLGGLSAHQTPTRDDLLAWCLIGFFTTQIAIFSQYWPVSFFQKSALGTTIFYFIWQLWMLIDPSAHTGRKPLLAHFIFVGLAVMVVIVSISWTTWPGLNSY